MNEEHTGNNLCDDESASHDEHTCGGTLGDDHDVHIGDGHDDTVTTS